MTDMKKILTLATASLMIFGQSCTEKNNEHETVETTESMEKQEPEAIFPKGEQGPEKYFTGTAWNYGLLEPDSTNNTIVGNVYFEPGARSNWHTHPAGQILIITDGVGYHQIEGEPIETIKKGDVVWCPPNAKHWHGASEDVGLQQIYVVPEADKGVVEWMGEVTDEQYNDKQS